MTGHADAAFDALTIVNRLTMPPEGCGRPGATMTLWYPSSWGSRPVALHELRSCALEARDRLGGRAFLSPAEVRLLTAAREYAGWWRRWHTSERAEAT